MIKERLNQRDVNELLKDVEPLDDYSIEGVRALVWLETLDDAPYNRVIEYAYDNGAVVWECKGVCEICMPGCETFFITSAGDCAFLSELDTVGLYTVPGLVPYTFYDIANMITPRKRKLSTYIKSLLNCRNRVGIVDIIASARDNLDSEAAYAFTELARAYYEKEVKPYENN